MPTDARHADQGNDLTHRRASGASGWRVILIGRTGLDQVLRRVEGVELIRTRDTFDAIGELSDPIDDASPARAAVLVAPDAEPQGEELARFIEALRMVDAGVKVIRVGERHAMYDGAVSAQASAAEVMGVIQDAVAMPRIEVVVSKEVQTPAPKRPEPVQDQETPSLKEQPRVPVETDRIDEAADARRALSDEANVREVMKLHQRVMSDDSTIPTRSPETRPSESATRETRSRAPINNATSDEPVIRAMGEGRSVIDPAMELIAIRTGRKDLSFTTHQDTGTAVLAGGKLFGSLVCADSAWARGAGARAMLQHASWLGSWLRLEAQQRELRLAAFTDELTGAWNRRYFTRFLSAAIDQARSARRTLTLLYFDIDDFKGYNDRYGHAAGDEILVETVRLLESVIRPGDKVCRIGGDEFVVIFYEPKGPRDPGSLPPESIYELATRFQKQICEHRFPKLGDEACGRLTVSGGLASYPWDGSDGESLLAIADDLALQSKRQGKNVITMGGGAQGCCRPDPSDQD